MENLYFNGGEKDFYQKGGKWQNKILKPDESASDVVQFVLEVWESPWCGWCFLHVNQLLSFHQLQIVALD